MAYRFKHGDRPLEGYTIQRAVGGGGFGEVYYAISDGGREVALKYLRDNPSIELRGVSTCMNLKSPYLVNIFDVRKTTDGEYFIVMEYCSGPSLRDILIAEPNGLGQQKAAFFVREIGKGLAYLHDRGIVHRDLKPGNIFYDDGYVKIGDYGLSKFMSISRHSGQTASVGTVHYMAPEIGSGNYDRGVDIYALGVMLYEMLLGKAPFEGSTMGEVLMKHLTSQPEVDHLPAPFGQVIRRALMKDPRDRYQTVDEMIGDLLQVEDVQRSLAGFSPKSLDGAVRLGAAGGQTPMPSPNPAAGFGPLPRAIPVGDGTPPPPLPEKMQRRMDRLSRRIDQRVVKLGGRGGSPIAPPPPPPGPAVAGRDPIGAWGGPVVATEPFLTAADRKKRLVVALIMCVGLSVGVAFAGGGIYGREEGAAAGLMVVAFAGGLVLSRRLIQWVGHAASHLWVSKLLTVVCCAAPGFLAAAPLIDRYEERGVSLVLGLLAMVLVTNWDAVFARGRDGQLHLHKAIGSAFTALMATVIAMAFLHRRGPEPETFFLAAIVAAAVTVCVHLLGWSLPAAGALRSIGRRDDQETQGLRGPIAVSPATVAVPQPPSGVNWPVDSLAGGVPGGSGAGRSPAVGPVPYALPVDSSRGQPSYAPAAPQRTPRSGTERIIFAVVTLLLMGGSIIGFVGAVSQPWQHQAQLAAFVMTCIGCFTGAFFTVQKTTRWKRRGFWRETLLPFFLSAALFATGASITFIATIGKTGMNMPGLLFPISGLVFAGIAVLVLLPWRLAVALSGEDGSDRSFILRAEMGVGESPEATQEQEASA